MKNIFIGISIFLFVYFLYLILISYFPSLSIVGITVIGQLLTLPLVLLLLFSFIFSIIKIFNAKKEKAYKYVCFLNTLTIIMLIIITIIQIQ